MSERNYRETTDREEIRTWADDRGVVPVQRGEADELAFTRRDDRGETDEELTWEEFDDEFDRRGTTFRYEDSAEGTDYELAPADESADRDAERLVEEDTVEEGDVLEAGETARSEVTETKTIEKEVVETATVETEVIDEEIVGEEIIDEELLDRELSNCRIDEGGEYVESDLRERKRITTEVRERDRIRQEVVDADAEETRTLDSDTTDRDVDIEGERELADEETVEHTVDETDIDGRERTDVDVEVDGREADHEERIERRMIETEVVENYHIRAAIEDRDLVNEEVVGEEVTDTELLDGADATVGDDTGIGDDTTGRAGTASETEHGNETGTETADHDEPHAEETGDSESTREETGRTERPSHDDEGKEVLNADGETVGTLADADDETIRIDAESGLLEGLLSPDSEDEEVTVRTEHVESVEDEVRLSSEGQAELENR